MDDKQPVEYVEQDWINSEILMKSHQPQKRILIYKKETTKTGFTLVEVLVAGSITLMVMVAVARVSVQAITSGRHRMERDRIEAAIHNNIQLIQQADANHLSHQYRSKNKRMPVSIQADI